MTDARSAYDESNEVWPFFLITLLGIVLVPLTLQQVRGVGSQPRAGATKEHQAFRAARARRSVLTTPKFWFVVAGWAVVAYLLRLVQHTGEGVGAHAQADLWDPYEILRIGRSASLKEIKSAYRKLSLQFHPDKIKDIAESAREEVENAYVEISKAYRALTDEVTRENYLQYGHPDGPQPVAHGVALPAFLFNSAASTLFLSTYLLGFGVGVPLVVAYVWTRSKQRNRHGILQQSAAQFVEMMAKEQPHFLTRKRVLTEVLSCPDMTKALDVPLEKRWSLLESYLARNTPQTDDELTVATETVRILDALNEIAAAFRSFVLCRSIVETRRAIVQAVSFDKLGQAESLQLTSDRKELVVEVEKARAYLPVLKLYNTEFRMLGAERVYTNGRVHLEIKFAVVPLGDKAPAPSADELEKLRLDDAGSPDKHNASRPALGPAVAPFFPLEVPTAWQIYVYGDKDNKLVEKPLELTHMDLHNLKLTRAQVADNEDVHYDSIVIPMSTATPSQPGMASMRVAALSTTYFGCDMLAPAVMNVEPAPPAPPKEAEEEEDEDSEEEAEGLSDIDTTTDEEEEEKQK